MIPIKIGWMIEMVVVINKVDILESTLESNSPKSTENLSRINPEDVWLKYDDFAFNSF
jgi:hypothetical protein